MTANLRNKFQLKENIYIFIYIYLFIRSVIWRFVVSRVSKILLVDLIRALVLENSCLANFVREIPWFFKSCNCPLLILRSGKNKFYFFFLFKLKIFIHLNWFSLRRFDSNWKFFKVRTFFEFSVVVAAAAKLTAISYFLSFPI